MNHTELLELSARATLGEWAVIPGDDYWIESPEYPKSFDHPPVCTDNLGSMLAFIGNRPYDFGSYNANLICAAVNYIRSPEFASLVKDAERYKKVRRGQHWDVVDGKGDSLRAETLDAAVDAKESTP